eukprot:gene2788-3467_t
METNKRQSIFFGNDSGSNTSSSDLSSFTKRATITPSSTNKLDPMVDTESEQKYQEIIELLVTGGYFRARINGLSPFDKVIGGMAWSITASNVDVDADLFFQENSNIKQKIAISEELIKALNRMKCPFPLQAQQIQGLNYINLFPIIRWLIAKVIETREETGDLLRMYSESMFSKDYSSPIDIETKEHLKTSCQFVGDVESRYKPSRKFRKAQQSTKPSPHQTLLEYGKLHRVGRIPTQEKEKSAAAQKLESALASQGGSQQQHGEAEEEEKRINQMMKGMKGVESDGSKVSGGVLKSFLATDEIQSLSEKYSEMDIEGGSGGKMFGEKMHRQKILALEKQIATRTDELKQLIQEHRERATELEELQLLVQKKTAFNERIIRETEKLDALETPENTKQLQALRSLVLMNETLIAQEQQFRQSCKRQVAEYKQLMEELVKGDDNIDTEDEERKQQINQAYDTDVTKLKKLKQLLNKKNRDISLLQRLLDELPSRAELLQYQRQFVELSEQSDSKLTETRQFYTTYNTLEDKRALLEYELSILQSIQNKYNVAMSSKSNKEMFIKSMDLIISGIQEALEKSEKKWSNEKLKHDLLSDQYIALVEQERNYYKLTKEFEEECRKNELLQSKLSQLQQ